MKIGRLPALVRTTTFRLALLHASIFILFSASLLAYLYYETAGHLGRQAESELNAEFQELSAAYRGGGLDRLNQAVFERSEAAYNKFFYLLLARLFNHPGWEELGTSNKPVNILTTLVLLAAVVGLIAGVAVTVTGVVARSTLFDAVRSKSSVSRAGRPGATTRRPRLSRTTRTSRMPSAAPLASTARAATGCPPDSTVMSAFV